MKVNRVDIKIDPSLNKHKKYLYNEALELMQTHKFGGEFANSHIKMNGVPEPVLELLNKAKIVFEKVVKKK